jgi:hypothetical protein
VLAGPPNRDSFGPRRLRRHQRLLPRVSAQSSGSAPQGQTSGLASGAPMEHPPQS